MAPVLAVLWSTAGCPSAGKGGGPKGTTLPQGTVVRLLVPISIPNGRARAGLPVKGGGGPSSDYEIHCLLEVRRVTEGSQEVPPGEYRVEKTETERSYFVDEGSGPYLVASKGLLVASERATPMYRITNVFFEPGQAAGIYRLTCSRLGGQYEPYVTIAEFNSLLAGVVEIDEPRSPG